MNKRKNNTTRWDGIDKTPTSELACVFGTPWLDHFVQPTGTGKGCQKCDAVGFPVFDGVLDTVTTDGFWSKAISSIKELGEDDAWES